MEFYQLALLLHAHYVVSQRMNAGHANRTPLTPFMEVPGTCATAGGGQGSYVRARRADHSAPAECAPAREPSARPPPSQAWEIRLCTRFGAGAAVTAGAATAGSAAACSGGALAGGALAGVRRVRQRVRRRGAHAGGGSRPLATAT